MLHQWVLRAARCGAAARPASVETSNWHSCGSVDTLEAMATSPLLMEYSRRSFLGLSAMALMGLFPAHRQPSWLMTCHAPRREPHPHPTPRPGITGDKVLTEQQLGSWAAAVPAFDEVRQIPEIIDGIRCNCGCAGEPGFYSLLSCYEEEGMARYCNICQGQGRLAFRLHKAGKTLDEIRTAIDARFS